MIQSSSGSRAAALIYSFTYIFPFSVTGTLWGSRKELEGEDRLRSCFRKDFSFNSSLFYTVGSRFKKHARTVERVFSSNSCRTCLVQDDLKEMGETQEAKMSAMVDLKG